MGREPGARVGPWRLVRTLGAGAYSEVWSAEDGAQRRAALKIAPPVDDDPAWRQRVEREVAALLAIDHPNVVRAFGAGWSDAGEAFLAMELLEGQSLAERMKAAGPLPAAEVVRVGMAAGALVVPPRALIRDGSRPDEAQIFVVVAGKADKRTVSLGVEAPDAVQVTKGLAAGEVVVLDPPTALGTGAPVEVQDVK